MSRFMMIAALLFTGCDAQPPTTPLEEDVGWSPPPSEAAAPALPEVWETCGDPVCSGWQPKGIKRCRKNIAPGQACDAKYTGKFCDPHDACNTLLTCDTVDPTGGGCPISKREAKQDITYLGQADANALAAELMEYKLARYRYKTSGDEGPVHLGFIIDDVGPSDAVAPSGERVDLYGYTSMAVATLQAQQQQIAELQAAVEKLQDTCSP